MPSFEDKFIDSVSYGLIEVLICVFFAAKAGGFEDVVAALTAAVIALVRDFTRAEKVAAGIPPTSRAGAASASSPPAAPLGLFLRDDIVSFVDRSA